jgi:hypothetical protein
MEKAELQRIWAFLTDVYEGICEQDEAYVQQLQLNELYRMVQKLTDAISESKDERVRLLLVYIKKSAIECKGAIEERLAVRN